MRCRGSCDLFAQFLLLQKHVLMSSVGVTEVEQKFLFFRELVVIDSLFMICTELITRTKYSTISNKSQTEIIRSNVVSDCRSTKRVEFKCKKRSFG